MIRKNMRRFVFFPVGILMMAMAVGSGVHSASAAEVGVTDIYLSHLKAERIEGTRTFSISFDLVNDGSSLDDLRLRVDLVKRVDGVNVVKDSWVDGTPFRTPQGTVSRSVSYTAPDFLGGEYIVQVSVNDANGMLYTVNFAGTVSLETAAPYVSVRPDECYLTVDGDAERYPTSIGVDVDPTETLRGHCPSTNASGNDIETRISVETFWRSVVGEVVRPDAVIGDPIFFAAGETKDISFVIPTEETPQAYSAIMNLTASDGAQASVEVEFHYVVRGQSATLRQSGYALDEAGDGIDILFDWMPSADSHFQARERQERPDEYAVLAAWKTASGETVLASEEQMLDPGSFGIDMRSVHIGIPENYEDLTLTLSVVDGSGNALDERVFTDASRDPVLAESVASRSVVSDSGVGSSLRMIGLIVVGALFLIALGAIFLWKRRGFGAVVLVLGAASVFVSANPAEAKTKAHRVGDPANPVGHYLELTMTADIDRRIPEHYLPGETMTVTSTLTDAVCNDGWHGSSNLKITALGSSTVYPGVYASTHSTPVVIPAGQEPGTYTVEVCGQMNVWGDPYDCIDLEFEVKEKTLKLCDSASESSGYAEHSDIMLPSGDSRFLRAWFGVGTGCGASEDADVTFSAGFTDSIADGGDNDAVLLSSGTSSKRVTASSYVRPLFDNSGRDTASETVTASYGGLTDSLRFDVEEICESRCAIAGKERCVDESFVTEDSCQQEKTCDGSYGTRDCEFNWTEPAPGM